jgi:glutamate--cysteine ligase
VREKNAHFAYYAQVVAEFCERFNVNPLLISARFATVDHVDFESKEGLEVIAQKAQALFDQMDPGGKIFLKASQGTYGMGITVIESAQEILEMNRKTRNKMDVGKNNIKFSSVLIQEGIETMVTVDGHPAEITIYLVGGKSTGGFMRSNPLKDSVSNLNSKGMVYKKYCISEIGAGCDHLCKEAVYCLVARLSTIATALEIQNITT